MGGFCGSGGVGEEGGEDGGSAGVVSFRSVFLFIRSFVRSSFVLLVLRPSSFVVPALREGLIMVPCAL